MNNRPEPSVSIAAGSRNFIVLFIGFPLLFGRANRQRRELRVANQGSGAPPCTKVFCCCAGNDATAPALIGVEGAGLDRGLHAQSSYQRLVVVAGQGANL